MDNLGSLLGGPKFITPSAISIAVFTDGEFAG
jgi:hypothetical protein